MPTPAPAPSALPADPLPDGVLRLDLAPSASVPDALRGGVVALGNFDGFHPGHRHLLAAARTLAAAVSGPAVCLTFEPHPRTVLRSAEPVFRLTPVDAKLRLTRALGIDALAVLPFNHTVAALAAEAFVATVLVGRLGARGVVVGADFRFGHGRAGSVELLTRIGAEAGFAVTAVDAVVDPDGVRYGSGRVRDALAAGDIAGANALLGYRWFIIGTVIGGDRRGRELGYPTANIALPADCRLRHGIYAVTVARPGGPPLPAVASFGRRPTFGGGAPLLEVHLFDFAADLYGERLTVTFQAWLRPEEWFDSVDALIRQMDRDSLVARAVLAAAGPGTELDRALARLA